jgi:hypothetical protein
MGLVGGAAPTAMEPQAGMPGEGSITTVTNNAKYQNVAFSDATPSYMYAVDSPMDPTRMLQDTNDATLENFFMRPVKLASQDWVVGQTMFFSFNPWTLYLENPRVANRIANFNLFRAKLRLKIVINGNAFLYGRGIASYLPLNAFDNLSTNAGPISQDIVQASQQPHIYFDPATSTAGEMSLPFFYHKNYVSIPERGYQDLGELTVRSINALKHANGAADKVTLTVFAWLEDVSLNGLTSVEVSTLIPQAGMEPQGEIEDANSKGFISGPATMVAKVAGLAKAIPLIAPFATATETAATAVAGLAKTMGYSRPPVTADPAPFKPVPVSSLALTTVPDTLSKLTVDDKQELSIDPRISGIGPEDPMDICAIAGRESYLTTFEWQVHDTSEDMLFNIRVDPAVWATSGTALHLPACAVAALPFKYWTGTMKYRFQVVCSGFHKGRLKIVFDPNFLASTEYNVNYIEIVDLAEKQDFTIEVANAQNVTLLDHSRPGFESVTTMYSTTPYASKSFGNGVLGVYVLNELTSPNSVADNDVAVNVFVSAGDDFEVFVPDDGFQDYSFKPQSGFEPQSGEEDEVVDSMQAVAPVHEEATQLGPGPHDNKLINRVFTGESISSFRTLIKRYNFHTAIGTASNGQAMLEGRRSMFPYLRGNVADAVDITDTGAPFNYCNTVLLHWVTAGFSGWRGGVRWKIIPTNNQWNSTTAYTVQRSHKNQRAFFRNEETVLSNGSDSAIGYESMVVPITSTRSRVGVPSGSLGMMYQNQEVNPVCEFEVPFYSDERFYPGKGENYTNTVHIDGNPSLESWDYKIYVQTGSRVRYNTYCAAAEDFQVYFFTGMPRLYTSTNPLPG